MLLPDLEDAFWEQVQLAHQAWLKANGHDQDAELDTWPFERSDNIALLFGNVMLKYDIARIAPYSSGHPTCACLTRASTAFSSPTTSPAAADRGSGRHKKTGAAGAGSGFFIHLLCRQIRPACRSPRLLP